MKKRNLTALLYAVGNLGLALLTQVTVKWYQYYYSPPALNHGGLKILVPLGLIGFAMMSGRIFDGVSNPVVAYFSDSCKSKRGRRIPFILYGSLPLLICFILIWFPPVAGASIVNFVYLTVLLCLFFTFFTIVGDPYYALIGEITKTKEERINLTMMLGIFQVIGAMIAEAGSGFLIDIANFKVMGITLGLLAFATIIITPLFVKEDELDEAEKKPLGIRHSIKKTLTNKDFIFYLVAYLGVWFGINILTISMPYICEVLLKMKAEDSGFMIAGAFIVAILFSPFLPKITLKFGKKRAMMAATFVFGILLMSTGLFGTVFNRIASTVIVFLVGIPLAAVLVIPNAIVADVAEMDGITNGLRREGMFFGTQGLVMKLVIALSSLMTPLLFNTFGYSAAKPLGLQLCGPVSGLVVLVCVLFLKAYSLSEETLEAARRGKGSNNLSR